MFVIVISRYDLCIYFAAKIYIIVWNIVKQSTKNTYLKKQSMHITALFTLIVDYIIIYCCSVSVLH